jgi:hypothetical protein
VLVAVWCDAIVLAPLLHRGAQVHARSSSLQREGSLQGSFDSRASLHSSLNRDSARMLYRKP